MPDLSDLNALMAVAEARGFRQAARASRSSASALSDAVRRLEAQLGVRLLNRTTRSVTLTEAGARLIERLRPAMAEVDAAIDQVNAFREAPAGTLRLNVPSGVARLVLPDIVPDFLAAYPDIQLEVVVDERFVDIVADGCDAGVRYGERLEQDMIAIPIGPRLERYATGASPAYLAKHGRPAHPRDLLNHRCIRGRFTSGAMTIWEFQKDGETVRVEPSGPLIVTAGPASDLGIAAAIAGTGIVAIFENWLRPHFESGALEPVLEDWWDRFDGPFLYFPSRKFMPAPLRAFVDFLRARNAQS